MDERRRELERRSYNDPDALIALKHLRCQSNEHCACSMFPPPRPEGLKSRIIIDQHSVDFREICLDISLRVFCDSNEGMSEMIEWFQKYFNDPVGEHGVLKLPTTLKQRINEFQKGI